MSTKAWASVLAFLSSIWQPVRFSNPDTQSALGSTFPFWTGPSGTTSRTTPRLGTPEVVESGEAAAGAVLAAWDVLLVVPEHPASRTRAPVSAGRTRGSRRRPDARRPRSGRTTRARVPRLIAR